MVGVPGKSQACANCKRRRVKCDFKRPCCSRCEKAGINCTGYNRDFIFVNKTSTRLSTNAATVLSALKREEKVEKFHPRRQYDQDLEVLRSKISDSTSSRQEFRTLALTLVKKLYLPKPELLHQRQELGSSTYAWVYSACGLSGYSQALDYALLAFCVILVHITHVGSTSFEEVLRLYSEGIERLRTELEHSQTRCRDETVAAIVTLSTCELFISTVDFGWRAHAQGGSEILRLRASEETPSVAWSNLCSRLRIICTLDALSKRRSLTLTTAEWRGVVTGQPLTQFDELMEILTDIPALLEETDLILSSVSDSTIEIWASPVLKGCMSNARKIQSLQSRARDNIPGSSYWAIPSTVHNPSDDDRSDKLFPFSLEFDSVHSATFFVLSMSTMLVIFSNMIQIYDEIQDQHDNPTPLEKIVGLRDSEANSDQGIPSVYDRPSVDAIKAEADRLARYICQSIEYLYRVDHGILGPQSTTYSQSVLRKFFRETKGYERELAWILQVKGMQGPGHRVGVELMTFQDAEVVD